MNNLLLGGDYLPNFSKIPTEAIVPTIREMIDASRLELERMLNDETIDWSWFERLEDLDDLLDRAWSPVSHLNNVASNDALRAAHDEAVQLLTSWGSERGQNKALYQAFVTLSERSDGTAAHHEAVRQAILGFQLSGVDLDELGQKRMAEIKQSLAKLSNDFSNNVLDATQEWSLHVESKESLTGLPNSNIEQAEAAAKKRELTGYVLTLDAPQYIAVMTFLKDRTLREKCHRAFVSRASTVGGHSPEHSNEKLVEDILSLRLEMSKMLGYKNYAELSLAKKMAGDVDEVFDLINELAQRSKPQAEHEFSTLRTFAKELDDVEIEAWDIAYYSELLKQRDYSISAQQLKEYFPVDKVKQGLFDVVTKLFDVSFVKSEVDLWHSDAEFFWVYRNSEKVAGFYFDLFAREGKRQGAWMDTCRHRRVRGSIVDLPIAYLTCNFPAPTESTPSLLTHADVTTLFHEFGHGLHHMLTQVDVLSVAGINGVAWDAVELPSQMLENWCWEEEVIPLISQHYQSGTALPKEMLEKMLAAKNFQSAMAMLRQLEFAYYDMQLHRLTHDNDALDVLNEVREQLSVIPAVKENRFPFSFSHIFAGGYAAGYYSYKWAEVLSSDAYAFFEDEGIFNRQAATHFLKSWLSQGGSQPAANLYQNFRGRRANIDALIRHSGIKEEYV